MGRTFKRYANTLFAFELNFHFRSGVSTQTHSAFIKVFPRGIIEATLKLLRASGCSARDVMYTTFAEYDFFGRMLRCYSVNLKGYSAYCYTSFVERRNSLDRYFYLT